MFVCEEIKPNNAGTDRLSEPISCECCDPPRQYFYRRGLRRHQHLMGLNPPKKFDIMRSEYEANPRLCKQCDVIIPYSAITQEPNKIFCSRPCSTTFNNFKRGLENLTLCENCGERTYGGARCCSIICYNENKYRKNIEAWKSGIHKGGGANVSSFVRRYLFEKFGECCSRCAWSEINPVTGRVPLQVDHKNGDSTDHREVNLDLLCPNCHALTTTYGFLNKGNGRELRQLRRLKLKQQSGPGILAVP